MRIDIYVDTWQQQQVSWNTRSCACLWTHLASRNVGALCERSMANAVLVSKSDNSRLRISSLFELILTPLCSGCCKQDKQQSKQGQQHRAATGSVCPGGLFEPCMVSLASIGLENPLNAGLRLTKGSTLSCVVCLRSARDVLPELSAESADRFTGQTLLWVGTSGTFFHSHATAAGKNAAFPATTATGCEGMPSVAHHPHRGPCNINPGQSNKKPQQ